jgi:hypothetical protein
MLLVYGATWVTKHGEKSELNKRAHSPSAEGGLRRASIDTWKLQPLFAAGKFFSAQDILGLLLTAPAPTTSKISRWGLFYPHLSKIAIFSLDRDNPFHGRFQMLHCSGFLCFGLGVCPNTAPFHLFHLPFQKIPIGNLIVNKITGDQIVAFDLCSLQSASGGLRGMRSLEHFQFLSSCLSDGNSCPRSHPQSFCTTIVR